MLSHLKIEVPAGTSLAVRLRLWRALFRFAWVTRNASPERMDDIFQWMGRQPGVTVTHRRSG